MVTYRDISRQFLQEREVKCVSPKRFKAEKACYFLIDLDKMKILSWGKVNEKYNYMSSDKTIYNRGF